MSLKVKRFRSINWDEEEKDITENIVQSDLAVCENIHLGKQEAGSMSMITAVEDHIPAASQETKDHEPAVSQESIASMNNNYVDTMVNYTKSLKDQEHQKRLEIMEVELNIQKEKLKSAILEREIFEIRKAKELS